MVHFTYNVLFSETIIIMHMKVACSLFSPFPNTLGHLEVKKFAELTMSCTSAIGYTEFLTPQYSGNLSKVAAFGTSILAALQSWMQ